MPKRWLFFGPVFILVLALFFMVTDWDTRQAGERDFRIDGDEELVRIDISHAGLDDLVIEKAPDGQWYVNETYQVDERALRDLIAALNQVEVRRPVPGNRRSGVIREMHDSGIEVRVYASRPLIDLPGDRQFLARQKEIRHYLIHKSETDESASIMSMKHADMPYEVRLPFMPTTITQLIPADEKYWRNPFVSHLDPREIQKIEAVFHDKENQSYMWVFDAEHGLLLYDYQGNKVPEDSIMTERIGPYLHQFKRLRHEKIISKASEGSPPDIKSDKAFYKINVHDVYGNVIEMEFFKRLPSDDEGVFPHDRSFDPNRFYLRLNGQDYALAQYVIFHPVIRPISWFLQNGDNLYPFFE